MGLNLNFLRTEIPAASPFPAVRPPLMKYFSSGGDWFGIYQTLANYVNSPIRPANAIRTTRNVIIHGRGISPWRGILELRIDGTRAGEKPTRGGEGRDKPSASSGLTRSKTISRRGSHAKVGGREGKISLPGFDASHASIVDRNIRAYPPVR